MTKVVGKYQLGKTLGQGTFSKVKLGVDTTNGETFAIKVINKESIKQQNLEEQLKKEITILKMLKHKHLIALKEVLQTKSNVYMVMELVTGGELFDRIVSDKKLVESVARRYFQQLICGLQFCHENGVAHRDLKPENLLLDKDDNVKISDFGLSSLSSNKDQILKTACGTPNYVAPEVLLQHGYDGKLSDVWSAGCILFVMCSGHLPFEDDTMNGLFKKILSGDVKYPSYFSKDLVELLSHVIVVDPLKRWRISDIMKHRWFLEDFDDTLIQKPGVSGVFAGKNPPKNMATNQQTANTNIGKQQDGQIQSIHDSVNQQEQDLAAAIANQPTEDYQEVNEPKKKPKKKVDIMTAFDLVSSVVLGAITPFGKASRKETRFIVAGEHQEVMEFFMKTLGDLKANPVEKKNSIKSAFQHLGVLMMINIDIYPVIGGCCLCEVRKLSGDPLIFRKFYNDILDISRKRIVSNFM